MPKETIYGHADQRTSDTRPLAVEVGWDKASSRPGATVTVASYEKANIGPFTPSATESTPLNRADINQLIRVLRKARDEAYGSDA